MRKRKQPNVIDYYDTLYTSYSPYFRQKAREENANAAELNIYDAILSKINIYTGETKGEIDYKEIAEKFDYQLKTVYNAIQFWISIDLLIQEDPKKKIFILPDAQVVRAIIDENKDSKKYELAEKQIDNMINQEERRTGRTLYDHDIKRIEAFVYKRLDLDHPNEHRSPKAENSDEETIDIRNILENL